MINSKNKLKSKIAPTLLLGLGLCVAVSSTAAPKPSVNAGMQSRAAALTGTPNTHGVLGFKRRAYIGTGLGFSHLDPDTSAVPNLNVNDRVQGAFQLMLGADVHRHVSVELQHSQLGAAGLWPGGEIGYSFTGLSVLGYLTPHMNRRGRQGIAGFARLGVGKLATDSNSASVRINQVNSTQFFVGFGAEYATRMGLALRGEFQSYDADAYHSQLALLYRFGARSTEAPVLIAKAIAPEKEPVLAPPVPAVAVVKPKVEPVEPVAAPVVKPAAKMENYLPDIPLFSGVLEGVNFRPSSSELTDEATVVLDRVADTLNEHDMVSVEIAAHTDSAGGKEQNQRLSANRANSVVKYLTRKGIDSSRLSTAAYGEDRPIATNTTAEGRRKNRRVEISAQSISK